MTGIPTKRISARDRRLVAMHEAGHLTMNQAFGFRSYAHIQPIFGSDWQTEKLWGGQVTCVTLSPRRCSAARLAMIGIAGLVAETAWRERGSNDDLQYQCWQDILSEPDCMSVSDWKASGFDEPSEGDGKTWRRAIGACQRVAAMFDPRAGSHWRPLLHNARTLLVNARAAG